jgi:hypothetical protein
MNKFKYLVFFLISEVVCTVRLLLDYLLDLPIDIHSRMVVLGLAGDIDFEKPKSLGKGFVYSFKIVYTLVEI